MWYIWSVRSCKVVYIVASKDLNYRLCSSQESVYMQLCTIANIKQYFMAVQIWYNIENISLLKEQRYGGFILVSDF